MHVLKNVMVPMREGIHLALDVYTSSPDKAFPVLLERTPYGKHLDSAFETRHGVQLTRAEVAAFFVKHGYNVAYQDCRGRYASEGKFTKYVHEPEDGFDTCSWITRQLWCNGKIGTMGLSYAAHTQMHLASSGAPGITAMFVDSGGFSNAYQDGIRQGGTYELKQAMWCFDNAKRSPEIERDPAKKEAMAAIDIRKWFAQMPWQRGKSPVSLSPEYEGYLFDQWERGNFDEYWKRRAFCAELHYDDCCDAATVFMSGHYDIYSRAATDNFAALQRSKRGPIRLILGPWTHGGRSVRHAGNVDMGPAASVDGNLADDFLTLRLRWFDRWIKGIRNGVDDEPAVRLFVMGGGSGSKTSEGRLLHGGSWRSEASWPLADTQWTPYFLLPHGKLSSEGTKEEAFQAYLYDPQHPVPTVGGAVANGEPLMFQGAFDQSETAEVFGAHPPYHRLGDRDDVVVFRTEPLPEAIEVTGPIVAHLWISSDSVDTDFTLKLIDEYPSSPDYPQGYAMNLTDGILRARYRESWERPQFMKPGQVYRVTISAFPTSNLFAKGHRIRLDISSSNFPHFDANPNTGEPEGTAKRTQIARNRIHFGGKYGSHVVLPVIPAFRRSTA